MTRLPALVLALALSACGGGGGGGGDGGPDGHGGAPDAEVGPVEPIHFVGRFDASHRFAWPGSAILTRLDGTSVSVELDEEWGENWYDVTVDGVVHVVTTTGGDHTYDVATGLAPGPHDVAVVRRTESFYGPTRFVGFTGGTTVDTAAPTRLLELVGDSITCGYGVLGPDQNCSFTPDTEAETHAWGALAAPQVGALPVAIAYSGIGVYRNNGGNGETMLAMYERTIADDTSSAWTWDYTPDVVVVNLGTNDFSSGDPGQPFVTAYETLIDQIRGHYGAGIEIVVASSPMLGGGEKTAQLGYLQQVIADRGPHVTLLDLATQDGSDGYGCDWHPSEARQQAMADALAAKLRELLGW